MYSFDGSNEISLVMENWPFVGAQQFFPQDLVLPLYPVRIVLINLFVRRVD